MTLLPNGTTTLNVCRQGLDDYDSLFQNSALFARISFFFSPFVLIYAAFQLTATFKSTSDFSEIFQKNQQGGVGMSVLEYGTTALTILLHLSM